jgi:uncharacterized protein (TIGR03083 family)
MGCIGGAVIQDLIAGDRRDLAAVLAGLTDEQWDAPSLCDRWAVRHVVAHLTMPLRYSTPQFLARMLLARGNFQRMSDGLASRDGELPREQLTAVLTEKAEFPWKPPGGGLESALTHQVVHGLDITVALGLDRPLPEPVLAAVLGTVTGPLSLKHFGVDVSGLQLSATDLDWTLGTGSPVRGQARDLLLLLTGRRVPAGALTGAGAGSVRP